MTPITCRRCPFESTADNPIYAIREYHHHKCVDDLHALLEAESTVGTIEAALMLERFGRRPVT